MTTDNISHEGIITSIDKENIEIQILSKSACGACHIKSACMMSEMKEKVIIVPNETDGSFSVGDKVNVTTSISQGNKAVLFAYFIPIVTVIWMIFILNSIGFSQGLNALISLGCLIPYYILLFMFRSKFREKIKFSISKIVEN